MFEELKKTLDKGLEYAFMTTEKIAKSAKELAKENNLTKEEAKKLLDYLQKKSEETRDSMDQTIQQYIKSYLKKLDIPTREEITKLELRVKKLEGVKKPTPKSSKKSPKSSPKK